MIVSEMDRVETKSPVDRLQLLDTGMRKNTDNDGSITDD